MFVYYLIALLNLFLRATWIVNADPKLYLGLTSRYRAFGISLLEQTRRALWAYMRLETEHVKNIQMGKAVNLSGFQYSKTNNMKFSLHQSEGWSAQWLSGDYGFPLGYQGITDAYEQELIVEGDNGYYFIEPLVRAGVTGSRDDRIDDDDGAARVDDGEIDEGDGNGSDEDDDRVIDVILEEPGEDVSLNADTASHRERLRRSVQV